MNVINLIDNDVWNESNKEKKWFLIKKLCAELLSLSDWTQLPDAVLTQEKRIAWQVYREKLQMVEFTYTDPDMVDIPDFPKISNAPPTAQQLEARSRRNSAQGNFQKVVEINHLTQNQIESWLTREIGGNNTESSLNASINSADLNGIKAVLRLLIKIIFAQTKAMIIIAKLLVVIRDQTMPDQ